MAGEVTERSMQSKSPGSRRKKRRLAVRIDMTPMVDIAFLLLIFYMVTTVFQMPQAMEINLPPGDSVAVQEGNVLTIRVDADGLHWWNIGRATPESLPELLPALEKAPDTDFSRVDPDSLRSLLIGLNRANAKLNTVVLIHRDADYASMVNILDEIEQVERIMNAVRAQELAVDVALLGAQRFSYRYAMGEWAQSDDRVIADARRKRGLPAPD